MKLNQTLVASLQDTLFEEVLSVTDEELSSFIEKELTEEVDEGDNIVGELSPLETAFFAIASKYAVNAKNAKKNTSYFNLCVTKNNGAHKIGQGLVRLRIDSKRDVCIKAGGKIVEIPDSEEDSLPHFLNFLQSIGALQFHFKVH